MTEDETAALKAYLVSAGRPTTNLIAVVEVVRAAWRRMGRTPGLPLPQLAPFILLDFGDALADRAARIGPPGLRSLDAIHLASALELGADLAAFVSYDDRLSAAAAALGMPVVSPGAAG